jgi:hypothetical protein
LLCEQSRKTDIDMRALDDEDYVEDYLLIDRAEPSVLWFPTEWLTGNFGRILRCQP